MIFDHKILLCVLWSNLFRIYKTMRARGTTIVMVTHNEHDAKIAHRTIRLFDGQIVDE